jgi:[protein-PII] uridylyltransferase
LRQLRAIGPNQAVAAGRYQPETRTVEYQIGTYENITPGVFHKLTGALSGQGLQILSAEINTLADGLVFDRFFVNDTDFAGEPPAQRLADVSRALIAAISHGSQQAPSFRRVWRPTDERRSAALTPLPTQVHIDNSNSERYTIVDIFAADRMGLLYTITRTLFELGLSVSVAKIGTYLDQVVDVFYVTDQEGQKIDQEDRLHEIRSRLLEAVAELERSENEQSQQKVLGRR